MNLLNLWMKVRNILVVLSGLIICSTLFSQYSNTSSGKGSSICVLQGISGYIDSAHRANQVLGHINVSGMPYLDRGFPFRESRASDMIVYVERPHERNGQLYFHSNLQSNDKPGYMWKMLSSDNDPRLIVARLIQKISDEVKNWSDVPVDIKREIEEVTTGVSFIFNPNVFNSIEPNFHFHKLKKYGIISFDKELSQNDWIEDKEGINYILWFKREKVEKKKNVKEGDGHHRCFDVYGRPKMMGDEYLCDESRFDY